MLREYLSYTFERMQWFALVPSYSCYWSNLAGSLAVSAWAWWGLGVQVLGITGQSAQGRAWNTRVTQFPPLSQLWFLHRCVGIGQGWCPVDEVVGVAGVSEKFIRDFFTFVCCMLITFWVARVCRVSNYFDMCGYTLALIPTCSLLT